MIDPQTAPARRQAAGPKPPQKRVRAEGGNLAPVITKETAREMALKSHEARRARAAEKQAAITTLNILVGEKLAALPAKDKIGELAQIIAVDTLLFLAAKSPKQRTTNENLNVLKAAWNIMQVDAGNPTAITWTEQFAKERLAELRQTMEQRRRLGFAPSPAEVSG